MNFAKLHGLGNDFVLIDLRGAPAGTALPDAEFARRTCDRHRGIGADGVLTLLDAGPEHGAEALAARLVIHNPDGSQPEMCGNGARCAALWIATDGCTRTASGEVLLLTDAGPRRCIVSADRPGFGAVEIAMGRPVLGGERALALLDGTTHPATSVSMGNPHRVLFYDGLPRRDLSRALTALCAREGPALCAAENANIEFVRWLGSDAASGRSSAAGEAHDGDSSSALEDLRGEAPGAADPAACFVVDVWERGAGPTLACGTGACAVAAAAIARGLAQSGQRIVVRLPGGALELRLIDGEMKMKGPAERVFTGTLELPARSS